MKPAGIVFNFPETFSIPHTPKKIKLFYKKDNLKESVNIKDRHISITVKEKVRWLREE